MSSETHEAKMTRHRRNRVCVDFDGVITQYKGWQGAKHFDPPTPGIREFLRSIQELGYTVCVYTARVGVGRDEDNTALVAYLHRHNIPYDEVWLDPQKPPALAYVDDRAVHASARDAMLFGDIPKYWKYVLDDIRMRVVTNKGPFEGPGQ